MSEEKQVPANIYELMDKIAQQQAQQQQQLDLLGKAIVEIAEKGKQQEQQSGGGGDFIGLLKTLIGGEEKSKASVEQVAKTARYFAMIADAVQHYRRPVLPYSGADKFLMRAGARSVYRMTYEGVKKKGEHEIGEEPSDEELDRMLGFAEENKEEAEEKKHV